jgi:thiamine biosynthesis lipoprotein
MRSTSGRRQFLGRLAWGLGGTLLAFRAPAAGAEDRRVVLGRPLLGTVVESEADHPDLAVARRALHAGFDRIVDVDRLMSIFRPHSEISAMNRSAGAESVPISGETAEVLSEALLVAGQSRGAMDVTIHPLVQLWARAGREGRLPARPELDRALRVLGTARLTLRAGGHRATLEERGAGVDLGGIAKGYAVDLAIEALRAHGVRRGIVNAGGDLRVLGRTRTGEPWRIGVRHPLRPSALVAAIAVEDESVATSGNYFRFATIGGREYGHVLDPRTGLPTDALLAATVVAPRAMRADALATAALVSGIPGALELLDRAGVSGLVVARIKGRPDAVTIHATTGLRDRITVLDGNAVLEG